MKLSEIKTHLNTVNTVNFQLPNGALIPEYFHVTEVGLVTRHFIDCGGTIRNEKFASFQLWSANDVDHRLKPQKLSNIIALSEKVLGLEDMEIEVEYQAETIGRYALDFQNGNFILVAKHTDCLAKDNCGTPQKKKFQLADLENSDKSCCSPASGCCS